MNMLLISGCERAVSIHSEHMKRAYEERIWREDMKRTHEDNVYPDECREDIEANTWI